MSETITHGYTSTGSLPAGPVLLNPWTSSVMLVLATVVWLLAMGGDPFGQTDLYWPLSAEVWSQQNSQHPIDPYTLTHMLHGVLCYWLIRLTQPKLPLGRQFFLAVAVACGWELIENSSFVIERYRVVTASADYVGDAVVNSVIDILACGIGFFLARNIGLTLSAIFFVAIELTMFFWIKDNLVLNVIMLLTPTDEIKAWQIG